MKRSKDWVEVFDVKKKDIYIRFGKLCMVQTLALLVWMESLLLL